MKRLLLICLLGLFCFRTFAQKVNQAVPEIGAQIWVEPGMDAATIDRQFAILEEMDMPITRLFLVWNWMEPTKGNWDFTLYDQCFESAKKHKVAIVATLMPNQAPTYSGPNGYYKVQDGAAAKTQQELEAQAYYIKSVVDHYKNHPALDTWMLMNEPGQFPAPDPLALTKFRTWLKTNYKNDIKGLNQSWLAGYTSFDSIQYNASWATGGWTWPGAYYDWNTFWRDHLTWYLSWIASEIRKVDAKTPLHVNPHALFDIQERDDLVAWSGFLNSLGCSVHPVWHFSPLNRSQYGNGVSYMGDYVRGAAGEKPFWITELQGGANLFTADNAITPTPAEIKRWLWTGVGTGAKRTIFWCLNPRLKGTEAGEWALLDYQFKPSDRLVAANQVAKTLKKDAGFWSNAEPQLPKIYLVQSKETMFQQQRAKQNAGDNIGRSTRAHKDAVLGTYLALQASGINPQLMDVPTMPWLNKDGKKKLAILPDASTITEAELQNMISFVQNGNTLVLSGLTGMFDQHESFRYTQKSLLNQLIGAEVKQIVDFTTKAQKKSFRILLNRKADKAISKIYKDSVWTNALGKGKVIITGAIGGLDHYYYPESSKWSALLMGLTNEAIRFERNNPSCYMRVMKSGNDLATIITNNGGNLTAVDLLGLENRKPILVAGKAKMKLQGNLWSVELAEAETIVIKWQ